MSGETDADDAALLDSLLATLDGDSDGDAIAQLSALVDSSGVGVGVGVGVRSPTSGCLLSAVDSLDLVFESDGDALLDLFSPPLGFDDHAPVDATAAPTVVAAGSLYKSLAGSYVSPPSITLVASTELETDGKIAVARSMVGAVIAREEEGVIKRKHDPNKARNERLKEIRELRRVVEDLTDHVKALKAFDDRTEKRLPLELSRRVRTERENVRLKRALDEQVNITKGLQRLIEKSNKAQKTVDGLDVCSSRRVYSLPSDSDADTEMFDRLVAEVDASYFEADGVFELNGIHEPSDKPRRGRNMRDGEHGRFVDMFSSDLLPFDVESTADVVWKFYSGPNKHHGPLYYKTAKALGLSKDTIVEKFAIELSDNSTRADFRAWQVLRRYIDADRVLVVWMCVIEPIEFANKLFKGCGFSEKGYLTCSSASIDGGAEIPDFTRLQRCHRVGPYTTHATGVKVSKQEKREIGAITEFVLSLDSVSVHLEKFHDELMQQSLLRQQKAAD